MQILFLNSIGKNKWGGGEKWMLMAAKGLTSKGHTVHIGTAAGSIIESKAKALGLKTIPLSFSSDFDLPGFIRLKKTVNKYNITHLVCGQNKDSKIGAAVALQIKSLTVIARHGLQLIQNKWKYKYIFSHLIHGIVTNSNSIKIEYDSYGWFPNDFTKVIYNGFNIPESVEPIDIKKQFNLPENALTIISAGRLAKQKGFEILIRSAEIANQNNKPWYFIIAGKGKLEKRLKKMVNKKNLENRFFFIGFINNVLDYVKGADLFVLPSFYEGMPNAVMEAMGMGKCCVVTSVNGNTELITHNQEGLIVEPGNHIQLYEAIEQVANNESLLKKLGLAARNKIENQFSENKMIQELESFLLSKSRTI